MNKIAVSMILILAFIASGCTGDSSPDIVTGKDKIEIQGNTTEQLEVQIKNNYEEPASFRLNITSPAIIDVMNSESEVQESFDMGEAASDSSTVKKVLLIQGNPEELGSLDSATDTLRLDTYGDISANISEAERTASRNLSVTLEK